MDILPDPPLLTTDLILIPDPLQGSDASFSKLPNRGAKGDLDERYLVSMVSVSWLEECVAKQEVLPYNQGNLEVTAQDDQVIPYELNASYLELRNVMRQYDWSSRYHYRNFFAQ